MKISEITIDALDRRIIHALLHDARAPFRRIAQALGTSEQTVARRYRRMLEAGVLRVVLVPTPIRSAENLFLRIRVQPGAALPIARAVAANADISWVTVSAGGSEVTCVLRVASTDDRDTLLLQRLPRASRVVDVSAVTLLHVFAGGTETEWHGLDDPLTPEQLDGLGSGGRRPAEDVHVGPDAAIRPEDHGLLAELARDGRVSYAAIAGAIGWSETQVARRVETLLDRRAVHVDLEIASILLGFRVSALLWLSAAPSQLDRVGREIAAHPESSFVAATTGPTNLVVAILCRDTADLYRYLTHRIGPIEGVRNVEVAPAMRVIKQHSLLMDGDRLSHPLASV